MTARVFLCEPSGLTRHQRQLSDRWCSRLYELGCDIDRVPRAQYGRDPWQELVPRISAADGLLVLGFEQLWSPAAVWRGQTPEASEREVRLSSPWLQIEVGIAVSAAIPVLVAAQHGISEGVFSPDAWIGPIRGTDVAAPSAETLQEWMASIHARSVLSSTVHGI